MQPTLDIPGSQEGTVLIARIAAALIVSAAATPALAQPEPVTPPQGRYSFSLYPRTFGQIVRDDLAVLQRNDREREREQARSRWLAEGQTRNIVLAEGAKAARRPKNRPATEAEKAALEALAEEMRKGPQPYPTYPYR